MVKKNQQLSPGVIYELVAEVGCQKYFHFGGFEATKELIELCRIDQSNYVLDVGCASGKTSCFLAQNYDCSVVGIDILERMIQMAGERARREGVSDRVEFRIADAQDLPFQDDLFDVVIGEFITGLLEEKQRV